MKSISKLLLAMGLVSCFSAQAQTENQDLCYPLAHGENGLGSKNSMFLPTLITDNKAWSSIIFITNTSYKWVNVRLEFFNYNASPHIPYDVSYRGEFNSSNTPLNLSSGGAILKPFQTGAVQILDDNVSYRNGFTGKVFWQANTCLDSAIKVDVRSLFYNGSIHDQGLVLLNGGNPF